MIFLEIFSKMLSAHKIKLLQSLDKKKFRQKYNLFLVEGNKNIRELQYSNYKIKEIFSTNPTDLPFPENLLCEITEKDLSRISFLQHPKDSVAVCELMQPTLLQNVKIQIVLDGIQDPGNLGTIIRLADWFGIEQIICSEDTVDYFNPKVIQASMGSFTRVNIVYLNISEYLDKAQHVNLGTDMVGESIYQFDFPEQFNLVLGNEGNGMRTETEKFVDHFITIPRFGKSQATESLNVSMAAGIILGEIFSKK